VAIRSTLQKYFFIVNVAHRRLKGTYNLELFFD